MLIISNNNFNENDYKAVNNIKALGLDMINEAQSGHPGIVLSAAPIIYTLYANHLNINPKDDKWVNRDRFVMSSGHGSALLYATLYMAGFDLSLEDLKSFRKINSKTPGHPELNVTPGVDFSTGPLGQGISSAVGMAIAEKYLNNRYTYGKNKSLIDHYTYCLCGDGDIMEGVTSEACSIAGNLGLGKLIVLYDSNNMTLDRDTKETLKENVLLKFKAMNWDTHLVTNGNDLEAINEAITKAKKRLDKPSIIEVKTILGEGSVNENTPKAHGKALDKDDLLKLKEKLGIRDVPFTVIGDAINNMQEKINSRCEKVYDKYQELYKFKNKKLSAFKEEFTNYLENKCFEIDKSFSVLPEETDNKQLREISNVVINNMASNNIFMTISADLATSTKLFIDSDKIFGNNNLSSRNIAVGVREHASAAIANGISSEGIRVFVSTFLSFSDYLKPALRMSALMNLPVTYIFTHDSILIGQDGPTHEPVEQLVGLRSIPNVTLYRPNDANELIGSYKSVVSNKGCSIIVVSKDYVKTKLETSINDVNKGAYIVKDFEIIDGIIISTGSELDLALEASKRLEEFGKKLRIVSMPSNKLFEEQSDKYKNEVLPKNVKKIVIEFASSYSWYKYCNNESLMFNVNSFGKSASPDEIIKEYKLDIENIVEEIKKNL